MRSTLLLALVFATPLTAAAQSASQKAEKFLASVSAGDIDKSIGEAFAESGIEEQKPGSLTVLKTQVEAAMKIYGKTSGIEKACEVDLSPSFKRLVYVQKFPSFPVAWQFYYYNPGTGWRINSMNFKDQVSEILDTCR